MPAPTLTTKGMFSLFEKKTTAPINNVNKKEIQNNLNEKTNIIFNNLFDLG